MFQFVTQEEEEEKMLKKRKTIMNQTFLLWSFDQNPKPSLDEKKRIADQLGLKYEKVNIWFQNERAKRRKHMEIIPFTKFTLFTDEKSSENAQVFRGSLKKNSLSTNEEIISLPFSNDYQIKYINIPNSDRENRLNSSDSIQSVMSFENFNFTQNDEIHKDKNSCIPTNEIYFSQAQTYEQFYQQRNDGVDLGFLKNSDNSVDTTFANSKKRRPVQKTIQIFPTCNNLFIPMKKIKRNGYSTFFNNGDTILVRGRPYRFKDLTNSQLFKPM
ncbi:putative homeobox domain containing protein [Pseudoloma neurophilia]|uniref:Putative homeobox domain containing protein n=1 Tax=Pseudoloma neurophilia TaxID=146866 RepID=A0A0R0M3M3_9MICR|nr:putative homeobox domain containing protein [Pseudoloma neurophilia]